MDARTYKNPPGPLLRPGLNASQLHTWVQTLTIDVGNITKGLEGLMAIMAPTGTHMATQLDADGQQKLQQAIAMA